MDSLINTLTKYKRICLLQKYRINTPNYLLIKKGSNDKEIVNHLVSFNNVSIRTQNPNAGLDVYLPKFINIDKNSAVQKVQDLTSIYDILVTEAIPPEYCIKCGNIALLENEIIVEIVYGAGTLDRLTRQGKVDKSWLMNYYNYNSKLNDKEILGIINKSIQIPIRDVILEFSIFSIKVGMQNKNYVVWEIINY